MQNVNLKNQLIALAGVVQNALWVRQIATQGQCHARYVEQSLESIFCLEPKDTVSVFGGEMGVRTGVQALRAQITGSRDPELIHAMQLTGRLLKLASKLTAQKAVTDQLAQGLADISPMMDAPDGRDLPEISGKVSLIYSTTLSRLPPQIMIEGNAQHLQREENKRLVRVFLMAGVRAGILWNQLGGSWLKLFFQRTDAVKILESLPGGRM